MQTIWTFQLDAFSAARLGLALAVMLIVPGWFMLSLTRTWKTWSTLTRWSVALAISIAFYPVLYYALRALIPGLALDRPILLALLGLGAGVAAWRWRAEARSLLAFKGLEWAALAVLAVTLATRFWVIADWPYPASPDSLHHALITALTVEHGQLPYTLDPYFPVTLDLYHLGLHALAAAAATLADVPAHAALLWTAQVLNGLCGIGVYVWLERRVGRLAGIVGLVTTGLLSFQPALLTSWGRFTPLGSQAILLVAVWLVEEGLDRWRRMRLDRDGLWLAAVAGLLLAGMFLIHFRVAVYVVPLLLIVIARAGWTAWRARDLSGLGRGVAVVVAVALLLILPALWPTLKAYADYVVGLQTPERRQAAEMMQSTYYPYTLEWINEAGLRYWLIALAAACTLIGLWRRNITTIDTTLWVAVLWAMGSAYLLGITWLQFTNMTAILIALYLPVGVLVGVAAQELVGLVPEPRRGLAQSVGLAALLLVGANSARARATEVLGRFQFVRAEDIPAMNWIVANTPADAAFAVNSLYFHPESLYGTDAGYWIPYFTGRRTTAGTMLFSLGDAAFRESVAEDTRTVKSVERQEAGLDALRARGFSYIYVGKAGNFAEPGLNTDWLRAQPGVTVVYDANGVTIFALAP